MLFRLAFAAAACCALSSSVLAANFAFSKFSATVVIGSITLDNARTLTALPVSTISAGKLTVTLEKTLLEDVQAVFGGTVINDGEAGNGNVWLCYATADATLWFSSFTRDGTVSQVTSDADTAHAATSGCSQAPAELTTISYGIPGLGAPLTALISQFGPVEDDVGLYGYTSTIPSAEFADFQIFQYVVVTAPAGTISGITVGQITTN